MSHPTTTQPNTTKRCLYCGNNPTSHAAARFDSLVAMTLGGMFQNFANLPGGKSLLVFAEFVLDQLWGVCVAVRVVRFDARESVVPNDRGRVLHSEATNRGHTMETAIVLGKPMDVYRIIFRDGAKLEFSGLPRLNTEDEATAHWIDDKAQLKQRLVAGGVRVSEGKCFRSPSEAEQYFVELNRPVIVKPRFGSRGRHTSTYLTQLEDFRNAFIIAQQLGHHVMVEEHLVGSVYRATMVDGKLAGVLAGDPPRVTGDGVHTIHELIGLKNENKHERVGMFTPTDATHIFLARHGYTLDTVLANGVTIDLTEKIGLSYGGNSREVTPQVHSRLRDALESAASVVGDPIIGFDFITPDVSADPDTVRWGIIECNAVPFINLHHDPLEGEPVNVAGIFLDYIERNLKVGTKP